MPERIGPCRRCGRTVPSDATTCRACGFDVDPDRNRRGRQLFALVGALLALALVAGPEPPILVTGLVCAVALWRALVHHRALGGLVAPR